MQMTQLKIYGIIFLLLGLTACQEDILTDITIGLPENLDFVAEVANDDSGTVTITPTADGAAYFEVDFGDGTLNDNRVLPGKSIAHVYPEGDYNVTITAFGLGGQSVELSRAIMVRFTPPANLELNLSIDPVQTNVVTLAPTADNALNFTIYFGEVANETPVLIEAGNSTTYTYSESGTYTVRVIANSASSTTIEQSETVVIVLPTVSLTLPVDFENPEIAYAFESFGGANLSVVDNPSPSAVNASARVAQLSKSAGAEVWAGGFLQLPAPIDFSGGTTGSIKVWSPKAGAQVLFKIENASDGNLFYEATATTTVSNTWEVLEFDFSGVDPAQAYHKLVVFMDFGNSGDGSNYFFDDISMGGVIMPTLALPLGFEDAALAYTFTDFGGATTTVIDNPDASGTNTSVKVAHLNKGNGAEGWAGSFIQLDEAIDFNNKGTFQMDVWSPKTGITVKLKVENSANPDINYEVDVLTTTANTWETLAWDFSGIDAAQNFDRVVVFFDFGTPGDGSDYYFDNLQVLAGQDPGDAGLLLLPIDFEDAALNWNFEGFGNVAVEVVDNPQMDGNNGSSRVAQLTKANGAETWGGAFVQLDEVIDFSAGTTFEMQVFAPKAGATVLLKLENATDGNIFHEVTTTTTVVGDWETLNFDFSGVNQSQSYQKIVIFFDFGVTGDGSVYLFDDITLK